MIPANSSFLVYYCSNMCCLYSVLLLLCVVVLVDGANPCMWCSLRVNLRLLQLWIAVQLLSGKQQQYQFQCACWIKTLPYKALGTVAPANYNFFSSGQTSLSAAHLF